MLILSLLCLLEAAPPGPGLPRKPHLLVRSAPLSQGQRLLLEAKGLRYAQRWYEAAALYRNYLEQFPQGPQTADARFWLAATLEQDQRWDEAADAYGAFLAQHPDQRMLGREAKLNRVRCWGMRLGQHPQALPGLLAALGDENLSVQVAAALQLARAGDRRAVPALQKGLALPQYGDACSLALVSMGVKPDAGSVPKRPTFLVIRIQEKGKSDPVTIRLALGLARALENYLSDDQLRQLRGRGVDPTGVVEQASSLPKGSVLFSVEDRKSSVQVTVE